MKDYTDYPVCKISNFLELLHNSVQIYGLHTAFRKINEEVNYQQFETAVLCIAGSLAQHRDCFFWIKTEDPYLFAVGYFAIVLTGNIAVLMNKCNCPDETKVSSPEFILTDEEIHRRLSLSPISYDRLPCPNIEKVCTLVYSSGTTSTSKSIMLSQKNLCCNVVSGLEKYRFSSEDRLIQLLPYYHAFGLVCDLFAPLLAGTTICIPNSKAKILSQMALFQPTMLNAPPAFAEALLSLVNRIGNAKTITGGQLRKILCGGAGLRVEITNAFFQYGIKALGCYGVTECSPCVSVNRDDYYKPGSAGVLLNCNAVRIAEDGEIIIRGDNVMIGYYDDLEQTSQVLMNGEYHTGDLGYLDEDGFLFVTGRKSNLIVFDDGTKCLPETLEQRILEHAAVREAVVFARRMKGVLRLCTLVYVPEVQQQGYVKQHILSIPTYQPFFSIEFVQEPLPKTVTGKLMRNL